MPNTSIRAVANFFVWFHHEHGDLITNSHLQKYLYYSQGWYLALEGRLLFSELLQAWVSGPVHPETYERFKHNNHNPIVDEIDNPRLRKQVREHLVEVHSAYGKFNSWDLKRMTHAEGPWREARGNIPEDEPSIAIISITHMREAFKQRASEQGQRTG